MSKFTSAQLLQQINGIAKRGKQLRKDCHITLINVIEHYVEHGDITLLPKLTEAVKMSLGSSLSAAMNEWVVRFVPSLVWNKNATPGQPVGFITNPDNRKREIRLAENVSVKNVDEEKEGTFTKHGDTVQYSGDARALRFYWLEREANQEPFNIEKAVKQLLARAKKAYEANTKDHKNNVINAKQIEALESIANNIGTYKAEDDAKNEPDFYDQEATKKAVEGHKKATRARKGDNKNTAPVEGVQEAA